MENITIYGVVIVPLIIGLVEVVKKLDLIPCKFMPLVALVFGLGAGAVLHYPDIVQTVVVGLALGLASVGLYSGAKNVSQ